MRDLRFDLGVAGAEQTDERRVRESACRGLHVHEPLRLSEHGNEAARGKRGTAEALSHEQNRGPRQHGKREEKCQNGLADPPRVKKRRPQLHGR
jgi:hypothetical protein